MLVSFGSVIQEKIKRAGGVTYVVRELQKRGALHWHVLVRFPVDAVVDVSSLEKKARKSYARVVDADGVVRELVFGRSMKIEPISTSEGANGVARYVSKALTYSLKDIATRGTGRSGSEHVKRLTLAAQRFICEKCSSDKRFEPTLMCTSYCHRNFGARNSTASCSRTKKDDVGNVGRLGWSFKGLTRVGLRAERVLWAEENLPVLSDDERLGNQLVKRLVTEHMKKPSSFHGDNIERRIILKQNLRDIMLEHFNQYVGTEDRFNALVEVKEKIEHILDTGSIHLKQFGMRDYLPNSEVINELLSEVFISDDTGSEMFINQTENEEHSTWGYTPEDDPWLNVSL
ncbi:MAG: hypothetical protein QM571_05675 [Micrococcaceae bacterium]